MLFLTINSRFSKIIIYGRGKTMTKSRHKHKVIGIWSRLLKTSLTYIYYIYNTHISKYKYLQTLRPII